VKALMTANYTSDYLEELGQYMDIRQTGYGVGGDLFDEDQLVRELAGNDIFVVGYDQVTEAVIQRSPDLKVIASIRGGPESNIEIDAATAAGIPVLYTIGRTQHAVAEYVMLFMLALARPLFKTDRQVRDETLLTPGMSYQSTLQGEQDNGENSNDVIWPLQPGTQAYEAHEALFGTELFAKKLGIVGFGNIGQLVAKLGLAFGMRVLVHDPYVDPQAVADAGAESVELMDLMSNSDYVTLHVRVTPSTRGMIGQRELKAMKPSACLINTARAALVDEQALIDALQEGWIRGVGLDVYHREPVEADHPLLSIDPDCVLLSAHLAGSTYEVEEHHCRLLNAGIIQFLQGQVPEAVKNPEVFDQPQFAARGGLLFGTMKGGN
jgi:D-3-phosphoglycerate dehydrogenase